MFRKKRDNRSYVSVQPIVEVDVAVAEAPVAKVPKAKAKLEVAEEAAEPKKVAAKKVAKGDDLKKIEGVGPKIAEIFANAGITTFVEMAKADPEKLKEILTEAGAKYAMHNPTTWPQQAELAADGKWEELKELQEKLDGGIEK